MIRFGALLPVSALFCPLVSAPIAVSAPILISASILIYDYFFLTLLNLYFFDINLIL